MVIHSFIFYFFLITFPWWRSSIHVEWCVRTSNLSSVRLFIIYQLIPLCISVVFESDSGVIPVQLQKTKMSRRDS